jgi:hypothetical protein
MRSVRWLSLSDSEGSAFSDADGQKQILRLPLRMTLRHKVGAWEDEGSRYRAAAQIS